MKGQEKGAAGVRVSSTRSGGGALANDSAARSRRAAAAELLVAAEISVGGIPAVLAPRNWPGFDVIALPDAREPQHIQVKSCVFTRRAGQFIGWGADDEFDWLAVVVFPGEDCGQRHIYILPRDTADQALISYHAKRRDGKGTKGRTGRGIWIRTMIETLRPYENNFDLRT
jgi:hypothetical protein